MCVQDGTVDSPLQNSKDCCIFEDIAALRAGEAAALTLSSHKGLAVVLPQDAAQKEFDRSKYFNLAIGPSDLALSARLEQVSTQFRGLEVKASLLVAQVAKGDHEESIFDIEHGVGLPQASLQ